MKTGRKSWMPVRIFTLVVCIILIGASCSPAQPTRPERVAREASVTPAATKTFTPRPTITATVTTPVAVIASDAQIRRLIAGVFAGSSQPLPEILTGDPVDLNAGGLVTTDEQGEAEVLIQGCLKLFVFQDASLERSTCRKSDAESGLGVCSTAGMTGVLNQCAAKIDIQTPGSGATTSGTWFAVIYLPEDNLSIVQVYEGKVDVNAVIDPQTGRSSQEQILEQGQLWFTAPGEEAPSIAGIYGREPQPMEVWSVLRPALIEKYPNLDVWMQSAKDIAYYQDLTFPDFLAPPAGFVDVQLFGPVWEEPVVRDALLTGIPWAEIVNNLWFDYFITPSIVHGNWVIEDAAQYDPDVERANKILLESGAFQNYDNFLIIGVREGNEEAGRFAFELQAAFASLNLKADVQFLDDGIIQSYQESAELYQSTPFILIDFLLEEGTVN